MTIRTLVATGACAAALAGGSAVAAAADPPASLPRTQLTGYQLVNRFMSGLQAGDTARIDRLLAPSFVIQRANGTWAVKSRYMRALPIINSYAIVSSHAVYSRGTITVRWELATSEVLPGAPVGTDAAPRLSTFAWTTRGWRMTSHANFNPPL